MSTVGQEWKHRKGQGINLDGHSICREHVTIVTSSQLQYTCNSGNVPGPHIILQSSS